MSAVATLEESLVTDTLFGEGEVYTVEAGPSPDTVCDCGCPCDRPREAVNVGNMLLADIGARRPM